ncbi:Ionotropic receptor 128 [Diabrotica virgifera virgifera]|nr:Ionotropic receptor 128 [Diabrotica virgifera virgifera]
MFFLTLVLSGIIFAEANISVKTYTSDLENSINELIKSIIINKQIVYAINTNIRIINYPVVFYNRISQFRKMTRIIPNIFVITGNISEVLSALYNSDMLDNSNYYIFYVQHIEKDVVMSLEQYFISRALLIMVSTSQSCYEIYKMTPDLQLQPNSIDICPKQKDFKIYLNENFKNDILKKTECLKVLYDTFPPFIISSTEGIHIELLNIIGQNMNLKLNFIMTNEHTAHWIPAEFITNHTYDLYTAFFSRDYLPKGYLVDFTNRITEEKVVMITPNILIRKNWKIFYGEFKNSVWLYFIFVLLSLSVVIYLIDYLIPAKQHTDILSFLLSLLFEGTVSARIYIRNKSLKIIFIYYLIFVVIFTTIYKSQMFEILRKNDAYNPIKRRIDIFNFNFKICLLSPATVDYFKRSTDPIEHYFGWYGKTVFNATFYGCTNMTAHDNNIITMRGLKTTVYAAPNNFIDENGYPLLNILEKDFHSYSYYTIAFRKGHPLFDIFNKKLMILKETGFVHYHYKIYDQQYEKAVADAQKKYNFSFKALNLSTLQSVFFAYFVLIGTSGLVFCLEILLQEYL